MTQQTETTLYFAYGSNLCTSDWNNWCDDRELDGSGLKAVCQGILPDYKLHFSHRSDSRNGGALNVVPEMGHVVHGVLMEADEEAWQALDRKEGAPTVYERVETTVLSNDGTQHSAIVYILKPDRCRPFVEPTQEYVDVVAEGLEEHELCTSALKAAAANKEPKPFTDAIFTYGTLMRGQSRFGVFAEFGIEAVLMGAVPGRLVDLGAYPGLLPIEGGDWNNAVEGDFIRVTDLSGALKALDAIEGFDGYGSESLFVRRLTVVEVGGKLRWAWVYEYNLFVDSSSTEIESRCWREHTGVRRSFLKRLVHDYAKHTMPDDIISRLRRRCQFDAELPTFPKSVAELPDAILKDIVNERHLAQVSGHWLAAIA